MNRETCKMQRDVCEEGAGHLASLSCKATNTDAQQRRLISRWMDIERMRLEGYGVGCRRHKVLKAKREIIPFYYFLK